MPRRDRAAPQEPPADPPDPEAALAALSERERAFVRALLRGLSLPEATAAADWQGEGTGVIMLGRPGVRAALLTLAPLLATDPPGEALARRLLRPYAVARVAALLAYPGQTGLAAARDLLGSADPSQGEADTLRRAWERRQASRGTAQTGPGPADPVA